MLKKVKVKDLMTTNVLTTTPEDDVVFAFEKLMKHKISALPVVDDNGDMVGIVSASDLGHNLILDNYKLGTKVFSVMVKKVASVNSDDSLYDAVYTMSENAPEEDIINQLPVLENDNLVGIISDGDIIKALKNFKD
ncbi:hypoxic response protein 1 [Methanobrevibacter cuticularis]|uniref:Hypoxic response protein 1 n=1 Tax=Methanobrevibacter cuticularis TaxID=47311 RepID=A0A166EN30_9EURY|nr:CBS domain-containing protein [Methanobrevibacter cuticularis]KZX16831.1 hypoxic response protein 1 [Methanobrevibacter cuticularis]